MDEVTLISQNTNMLWLAPDAPDAQVIQAHSHVTKFTKLTYKTMFCAIVDNI